MSSGSPTDLAPLELARLARSTYLELLHQGCVELVASCVSHAKLLAGQSAEPALYARRRDLVLDLTRCETDWASALRAHIRQAAQKWVAGAPREGLPRPLPTDPDGAFSLVDNAVIELDMMVSRLAQAIADGAGWQYTDLRSRLAVLEQHAQKPAQDTAMAARSDALLPEVLARWVLDAWREAPLSLAHWQTLQTVAHEEVAHLAEAAYHEANRCLLAHGVCPDIDLRPFIRRTKDSAVVQALTPSPGVAQRFAGSGPADGADGAVAFGGGAAGGAHPGFAASGLSSQVGGGYEETRLMTQTPGLRTGEQRQAVLGKLNQWVARQVPEFHPTLPLTGVDASAGLVAPALGQAIAQTQRVVQQHADTGGGHAPSPQALVRELQSRKLDLKQAASTPVERATIEIVALLFQSILTEERLPAAVRVWFARLQMPVLRVAVSEPDFFATLDHPARALIDRMGACVMGFAGDADTAEQALLHKEIKRVVQTIEAYPDTGRRVFKTVLTEFEKFLEQYFQDGNDLSRKGVSLAQQLEQREAYAIQYTIELRKMLQDVPVHEDIREFLFKVWADVLAHSALQGASASEDTRALLQLAGELIWAASAKTTRQDRHDVLQRLPPLLKALRAGMSRLGLAPERLDQHIKDINGVLSAAFSAKSAALSAEHLQSITRKLEALDEVLPELGEVDLDTDTFRDLSGYEDENMEVVADGGSMPTPAMLAWARELKLGAWFQLDYRGQQDRVQLAWRGSQRQLLLFVTPRGRGVLFQTHRLAAFLQAGLLVPLEEESLTVRATRDALAKLDADPERLLH